MYQIKCDQYVLYDPRDEELIVSNPKCKLQVNTVGEASFSIYATHPFYEHLHQLKSVFEILQDGDTIFRGRMTENSRDFDNVKFIDLEGAMAYFNDSVVRPFVFPDDFSGNAEYKASENVVEFFLKWLIDNHNSQVQDFQKFKLGNVTVSDSNEYFIRSAEDYASTWETLKSKLFESSLEGYLCIRYEKDGNYIDYLSDFELTNVQRVKFGENLLDISLDSDASATYSAVIPLGKKKNEISGGDDNAAASDDKRRLTIEELPDGDITEDIVKVGDTIFSKKAVADYGWIYAPTKDTTWDDVTVEGNLQQKGVEYLSETASKMSSTITITALDLHYSDDEIAAFRIYRWIVADSKPHGLTDNAGRYRLTALDIDLHNPQNTKITLGDTSLSLTDINAGNRTEVTKTVKIIKEESGENTADITAIRQSVSEQATSIVTTCEQVILSALESYKETENLEEFRKEVQSQLQIMSDEIALKFTSLTDHIEDVDGDLQEKFNTITKYFSFDINGLTIGQVDNPNKVTIDNDIISILVNDVVVQKFDSNGQALIPELNVTRKMKLFGYLIDQDEQGNVNCEYVGGES